MNVEVVTKNIDAGIMMLVSGDVDMNTSPTVRNSLGEVFKQGGVRVLLIDLSGVRYIDSSGIATLVEAMQNCMKKGMRLRLIELSPSVHDVFELARLASVFEIFATQNDAVAGL